MTEALRILDERIDAWITGFFFILPNLIVGLIVSLFFVALAFGAAGCCATACGAPGGVISATS